jgi:isoleucyl-tRNA synthetase
MAKYKEYKGLDLVSIDKEILQFWEENKVFQRSISEREGAEPFVFYEGPPSANGMPGIHHVIARTVKDLFCRFQTMNGKQVERKGGWDTHGLPIELNVEKELGITKEDIGKTITVEQYNQKCREMVMRFKDKWDSITLKMGYWVDLDNPYITFDNHYIESVWYLLSRLYQKNLLYKGYTIQPYSPAAGTGLSSHELNLPGAYKTVKDTSAVAMFALLKDQRSNFLFEDGQEDVRLLAWTTTPWTLPSNTALAVGGTIDYVQLATFNPYTAQPVSVIMAEALLAAYFKPEGENAEMRFAVGDKILPYQRIRKLKGADLAGMAYEQLLPYVQPEEGDAFKVILGDFVSTEDGTGIVHIAPSFGADDKRVAKENGIGALTLVDARGRFTDQVGEFAGRYVKDYAGEGEAFKNVDVDICIKLKTEGKAFHVQKYEHNYPHCWRTDKPILYYPLDSWFVRSSSMKERMAELNKTIQWKPAATGVGRFGLWLENLQDWNLSRSRFWGIPLPIWRSLDGEEEICIGSVAQLAEEIAKANQQLGLNQTVPEDLHRPYIDQVVLVDSRGKEMKREADLIDVWFDSGAMPYAQWHYPFENKEKFEQGFPADFIAEGVDQTRGWFYTLHAIATMVFDSVAFKNVISNGLIQDKFGQKMSKSKGNTVDPFAILEEFGADATRWYMITNSHPWEDLKFNPEGIKEVRRKFFGTLYNTYSFFALYANIDGFVYKEAPIPMENRAEIDRWIVSSLHTLVGQVHTALSNYEPTIAARAVDKFVDEHLSNWYVRLCRRRFWKGEYSQDKMAAYQTLYECLLTVAKLMAPVSPFFADWLYRNLNQTTRLEPHDSVHLSQFPTSDEHKIDRALEERMDYAQRICSLVLSLRKGEQIRVRQPLQKILLPLLDTRFIEQVDLVKDLILSEVNVKELEYITEESGVIKKAAKLNFKVLGKKLGKDMKAASLWVENLDQESIARLEREGSLAFSVEDRTYDIEKEELVITSEDIPGWLVASDRGLTVALDITLTPLLLAEGHARELVNRIQNIRKSKDFEVTDRIVVKIQDHEGLREALGAFEGYICEEVLADSIVIDNDITDAETVALNEALTFSIWVSKS